MKELAQFCSLFFLGIFTCIFCLGAVPQLAAQNHHTNCWNVDEVRAGMKGEGKTVVKGMKIQSFEAKVLGVLKNTSPGRDLVLCRLSGLNLEETGVIAGMSGSPIYIDGKLLGAVAYAWPFGKEPIAGVTPFCQMKSCASSLKQDHFIDSKKTKKISLLRPVLIGDKLHDTITLSTNLTDPLPATSGGLWLRPLQTPLSATGFTPNSLSLLTDKLRRRALVPMQGGAVTSHVAKEAMSVPLQPGGALTVALVTGDFDLSGIGTVTHIEGSCVYGWGHPFMGLGACELPLMTGYVHTICPRQNLSFKMGSPLKTVGVISADVSTCIAGRLGQKPDLLPLNVTVHRKPIGEPKKFQVQVVRHRELMPTLVLTALANSLDLEGQLPEELTAKLSVRFQMAGGESLELDDAYSGYIYSGSRAPRTLYSQVAAIISILTSNEFRSLRIEKIECSTDLRTVRRTAEIESIHLDSSVYEPSETIKATITLKPYKQQKQRVVLDLPLPSDLAKGNYKVKVQNGIDNARDEVRDHPLLDQPSNLAQLLAALRRRLSAKRTSLVLRVPIKGVGVALEGKALPHLPPSMVQILSHSRKTSGQTISGAITAQQTTQWVLSGSESATFRVVKNKNALVP